MFIRTLERVGTFVCANTFFISFSSVSVRWPLSMYRRKYGLDFVRLAVCLPPILLRLQAGCSAGSGPANVSALFTVFKSNGDNKVARLVVRLPSLHT